MDREPEDLQFLHVFGVLRESFKVLCSHAKLFALLALTITLPLCFIVLAHNLAVEPLISKINRNEDLANSEEGTSSASRVQKQITSERIKLGFLLAAYVVFVLAFALLSTAAIVYTVACIYTKRGLTYMKVISVVPKVWKRLLITFLWAFLLVFFLMGALFAAILFVFLIFLGVSNILTSVLVWIVTLYFLAVLFHFSCIYNLASAISVLEENYGLGALRKSTQLIKGKRLVAYILYAIYLIFSSAVVIAFDYVTNGQRRSTSIALRIFFGVIFALVLSFVDLLGTVVLTIFYFVCKSYHQESIDRLALSEHLGAYTGEYVTLRASIQMEAMQQA